jgi:hypothetical protein
MVSTTPEDTSPELGTRRPAPVVITGRQALDTLPAQHRKDSPRHDD